MEREEVDDKKSNVASESNKDWENFVLTVTGFQNAESDILKQLVAEKLNKTSCFRVRPIKGENVHNVCFNSYKCMKIAEELLNNINKDVISAKVVETPHLKQMLENKKDGDLFNENDLEDENSDGDEDGNSGESENGSDKADNDEDDDADDDDEELDNDGPKKKKQKLETWEKQEDTRERPKKGVTYESIILTNAKFMGKPYTKQVNKKREIGKAIASTTERRIRSCFPQYRTVIQSKQEKLGGRFSFVIDEIRKCPFDRLEASECSFVIGVDVTTHLPEVGFYSGNGTVVPISSKEHNFPAHVVETAQVFEKLVKASKKAPTYPPERYKFWHKLVIQTNEAKEMMLVIYVYHTRFSEEKELEELKAELKEFFENGEGKECKVTSIYVKPINMLSPPDDRLQSSNLVFGPPYLEQTIADYKMKLQPLKLMWNCPAGAEMLCKAVEEILAPTETTTILEVGCGFGLIGFHLSKIAGEVLSLDAKIWADLAKENAELNNITGCQYFDGFVEKVLPQIAEKITHDTAYAIVSSNYPRVIKEIRKIPQVKKVLVITGNRIASPVSPVLSLCRPLNNDPFFPVRMIPIDTAPYTETITLLTLTERIALSSLPKWTSKKTREMNVIEAYKKRYGSECVPKFKTKSARKKFLSHMVKEQAGLVPIGSFRKGKKWMNKQQQNNWQQKFRNSGNASSGWDQQQRAVMIDDLRRCFGGNYYPPFNPMNAMNEQNFGGQSWQDAPSPSFPPVPQQYGSGGSYGGYRGGFQKGRGRGRSQRYNRGQYY